MLDFYVAEVPVRDDPALLPLWQAISVIEDDYCRDLFGNLDLSTPVESRRQRYLMQEDSRAIVLVAVAGSAPSDAPRSSTGLPLATGGEEVLGFADVDLPILDNTELAMGSVMVAAPHRRHGIGTALSDATDAVARAERRTKIASWTGHRDEAAEGAPDALAAPTGAGILSTADPVVRFAQRQGYRLEQTERHSVLQLPVPRDVSDELRAKAEAKATGYRMLTWVGPTPPEHREGLAGLHRRMSVDVPMGALEFEEENWDADRVRRSDERQAKLGRTILTAVAQHVDSGELVAFTVLAIEQERPEVAYQDDTLVHGDHRGHSLGLAVKLANLDQLAATRPQVQRIHTWNAGENQWMLAINVAMGFTRASTEGAWQRHY